MLVKLVIYSEWISLLPGDRRSPRVQSHLLGQRLRDGQQDEADICQGDERSHQDHQVIPIVGGEVSADCRARHQACCERGRHLQGEQGRITALTNQLDLLIHMILLGYYGVNIVEFEMVAYESICSAPLPLLSDVCYICKDDREGD